MKNNTPFTTHKSNDVFGLDFQTFLYFNTKEEAQDAISLIQTKASEELCFFDHYDFGDGMIDRDENAKYKWLIHIYGNTYTKRDNDLALDRLFGDRDVNITSSYCELRDREMLIYYTTAEID